jgi:YHS domain-containing protein
MKSTLPLVLFVFSLIACSTQPVKETKPIKDSTQMQSEVPATIDAKIVDNTKDPACGMPVTAGIGDTTRYEGKLYGFCSKECKDEFLKNPKQLVAAAELKK